MKTGLISVLLVVCFLVVMALIVVPQFTNASSHSGPGSVRTQLQVIRCQIDLFKIQHDNKPPALEGMWTVMVGKSGSADLGMSPAVGSEFGPYFMFGPVNVANGQ